MLRRQTAFKLLFWILLASPLSTMSNPILRNSPQGDHDHKEAGHLKHQKQHHRSKKLHYDLPNPPDKWINPCRITNVPSIQAFPIPIQQMDMDMDIEIISQPDTDSEIISNIITQVNKAERQAKRFMGRYYRETFGEDLSAHGDKFSQVHYDFLKEINEKVKKSLLEKDKLSRKEFDLDDSLRFIYAGLQVFAICLEQIVMDQSIYGGNFHQDFQEAEYQLKYVLCEVQIAMLEKGIHQHKDMTRDVMSEDYREIDCDTVRNIRDWVIFRDYINTLEYIQQCFNYGK